MLNIGCRIICTTRCHFFKRYQKISVFTILFFLLTASLVRASDSLSLPSDEVSDTADVIFAEDSSDSSVSSTVAQIILKSVDSTNTDSIINTDSIVVDSVNRDSSVTDSVPGVKNDSIPDSVTVKSAIKDINKSTRKRKSEKKEVFLYPGISRDQDKFALQVIKEVYEFDWSEAERIAKKMQKLENHNSLPPLSYLLRVSMRVVRLQNSEFSSDSMEQTLLMETDSLVKNGMALSDPLKAPKTVKSTFMFIYSGIEGFSATLKINKRPVDAAIEGLNALKILEKLTEKEPLIKDVYLGLGIFYCALAKAPAIVRGALNITGRNVSFEKGVGYLRISAYEGRYTNETAKQYLIQFLNPYMDEDAAEKERVFISLQKSYPRNPYYHFLRVNEDLCFHKKNITDSYKDAIRKKLSKYREDNYSLKRYSQLLKYQYAFLDPSVTVQIDTSFNLRDFAYYPAFLDAMSEKYNGEAAKKERYKKMHLTSKGINAFKLLEGSSMSSNRKNFFGWYMRDALRDNQ